MEQIRQKGEEINDREDYDPSFDSISAITYAENGACITDVGIYTRKMRKVNILKKESAIIISIELLLIDQQRVLDAEC